MYGQKNIPKTDSGIVFSPQLPKKKKNKTVRSNEKSLQGQLCDFGGTH